MKVFGNPMEGLRGYLLPEALSWGNQASFHKRFITEVLPRMEAGDFDFIIINLDNYKKNYNETRLAQWAGFFASSHKKKMVLLMTESRAKTFDCGRQLMREWGFRYESMDDSLGFSIGKPGKTYDEIKINLEAGLPWDYGLPR